jgi:hypothetical protein
MNPPNIAQVRPIFKHDKILCFWAVPHSCRVHLFHRQDRTLLWVGKWLLSPVHVHFVSFLVLVRCCHTSTALEYLGKLPFLFLTFQQRFLKRLGSSVVSTVCVFGTHLAYGLSACRTVPLPSLYCL